VSVPDVAGVLLASGELLASEEEGDEAPEAVAVAVSSVICICLIFSHCVPYVLIGED
jgi:hypothetical protein